MSRSREEVQKVVEDCIRHTLGCEDDAIDPGTRLIADLGAESMDLVDIISRIGRRLGKTLHPERLDEKLREAMTAAELEQGLVTKRALAVLRAYFPEASAGEIYENMPLHEVHFLMSVKTLIDLAYEAEAAA